MLFYSVYFYNISVIFYRFVQRHLDETLEALSAAERLSEQLDKKEGMIAALREEGSASLAFT